ncbi:ArsR/SmtB family transcription factor [Roseibium sp.]|uniref:ArsR/SmtB family transcription factor n=1 Tax=Roseibium sp. TaxID=1936156 RepID=UPI003A97263F
MPTSFSQKETAVLTLADRRKCSATTEGLGPSEDERLATVYRALAHPARLAILRRLRSEPGACCGDIVKCLPLAQSTVSQHLQALKDAGLLMCQVKGRCCHYRVNEAGLQFARAASADFLDEIRIVDATGSSDKAITAVEQPPVCCPEGADP